MRPFFPILLFLSLFGFLSAQTDSTVGRNYTVETKDAVYPGGDQAMYMFMFENMEYPEAARDNRVEGKCMVSFDVMEDGSVDNVKVMKDLGYGLKEEAERLVKLLEFEPAIRGGKPARQNMMIQVIFQLFD